MTITDNLGVFQWPTIWEGLWKLKYFQKQHPMNIKRMERLSHGESLEYKVAYQNTGLQ